MTKMISLVRSLCVTAIVSLLAQSVWAAVDESGVEPTYWWTFDKGNLTGDDRAATAKGWSGAGDAYVFSDAGKAVKGGDPYIKDNGLNHTSWTASTDFTLVGSFRVNLQERGNSTANKAKAMLFGIGWNNTCYGLAADSSKVYLMWNSSNVSYTGSAAKGSLASDALSFDLTKGFHSYALVVDRTNSKLYVYVDGEKVIEQDGVTVNHLQNAGILSMPGGGEESNIGAARTKTMCDDYRIYTSALTSEQLKSVAATKYAIDNSGNKIDTLTATVSGDSAIDALSWDKTYNKGAKLVLNGSGKVTTTADTMPTAQVVVGKDVEIVYTSNPTAAHMGEGTVTLSGFFPNGNAHNHFTDEVLWTGTVKLTSNGNGAVPNLVYSNAKSTLCLNGLSGYLAGIWNGGTYNGTICLEDNGSTPAWNQNNGGSSSIQKIGALTGSGTWKATGTAKQTTGIVDGSQFTGGFDFSLDTCIKFGASTSYVAADLGYIIVNSDATVQIAKTWKPTKGLKLDGTIIAKGGTLGASTTVGNSATIDLSNGDLTLASGKSVSFGTALNLVGVTNGKAVIKGVASAPAGLNLVAVSVNGTPTEDKLTYDADSQAVVYTTAQLSVWTPNPDALENGLLVWGKANAWLDGTTAKSWSAATAEQDVKIDAASVSGVVISDQVAAHDIYVINSSELPMPFEFHNHTKNVDGTHEVDDKIDCLTANSIIMTGYHGQLGLKVPVKGQIGLGDNANLVFKTGTAGGTASTAYAYQFSRIGTIAVEGGGKFKVPAGMYGVSFAPQATATIVYDEEGTVTGAISGAGKVEVDTAAVTFNTTIECAGGILVSSGKAIIPDSVNEQILHHDMTVAAGAELAVARQDGFRYSENYTLDLAGKMTLSARQSIHSGLTLKLHNGATIEGTSTDGQGDWEYIGSGSVTIDNGATATIKRLGLRGANTLTVNGNNSTLKLEGGVYGSGKVIITDGVTIITASGTTATIEKAASVTSKILDTVSNDDGSKTYRLLSYAEAGLIKDNIFAGKDANYWKNIYTGPLGSEAADASVRNQWGITADAAEGSIPFVNVWGPALFDSNFIPNVAETEGYKSIAMTGTWEGWQLQLGLVNGVKLTVDHLTKIQDMNNVGCFIGVDATSKLIISDFKNGNNDGEKVFDVASPNGIEFRNGISGSTSGIYEYYFRGTDEDAGSILVNGAFSSGDSHKVKYVEISADEIGEGNFKAIKERKLIAFTSSTLTDAKISFASDAVVKVGDNAPSAAFAKPAGVELTAKDAEGTSQIILKSDGIYVQYIGWGDERPTQYQWEFKPVDSVRTGNWSGMNVWKGLFNNRQLTWSEEYIKTSASDPDFRDDGSDPNVAHYINLNPANDFEFFFDATSVDSVVVDTSIDATRTGMNPNTGLEGTSHRKIVLVGDSGDTTHPATFKFNLPNTIVDSGDDGVDNEGAPLSNFDWNTAAKLDVPVDATSFVGELGLRAKITQPISLGPNAKIVFVKPANDKTIAYDYRVDGLEGAAIEVRGGGEFIVPNGMESSVPFEITAGEPDGTDAGAGYIVYDVDAGQEITVTAAITGAGGVKKTGAGKLILAGECSFEGALEVLEGTVEMAAHDDNTRISAINVSSGATLTIKLTPEQKQTGYNATNVQNSGTFKVVDADGAELSFLNGTQIVPGTEKIWKQGVINSDFITSTPMAILYGVRLSEILPSGAYGTIVGKLSGNYINNNVASQAIDATGTIAGDTTMTVNDKEYAAKTLKIQATDGGVLKTHEIKICEIQDNAEGGLWKIWAQSVNTYNDQGNSYGADGVNYRAIMIWAKATQTLATIPGGYNYPTLTAAISAAASGSTEAARTITLVGACGEDITIPEGVTVDTNGHAFSGTLNGAGKIIYHGTGHSSALPSAPTLGTDWTGTVTLTDFCTEAQYTDGGSGSRELNTDNYANENSKIEFKGVKCYILNGDRKAKEVIVTDNGNVPGLVIRNGWSDRITKFKKLSGTGTIYSAWGGDQRYLFADATEFAGSVNLTGGAGSRRPGIIFGSSSESTQGEAVGKVQVLSGAVAKIAEGKTWTTPNGVVVNGVLDLTSGDGTDALVNGAMTIGETGAIRLPANWEENDKFTLCSGDLSAPDTTNPLAVVVGDYAFKAKLNFDLTAKTIAYRTASTVQPIAFWKDDFADGVKKNGVTLHANGNTIDATGVTIAETGTKGMTLDFNTSETRIGNQVTVLVKYSGLPTPSENSVFFSFASQSYNRDLVGAYLKSNGTLGNIWNDGANNGGTATGKPAKSGMIAATVSLTSSGAHGAIVTIKDDLTADYSAGTDGGTGLVASGQTMVGVAIGGKRNSSSLGKLVGMKIEAVAVFEGVLTEEEMENFHWGFDGADPTLVWQGENDGDISVKSNWRLDDEDQTTATEGTVIAENDLIFPATTETKGITVSADVAYGNLEFNGDYALKGNHILTVNSVKIADGATLRLESGVKLNFVGSINPELLPKITFAGGEITMKKVPHFTQDDNLVVDPSAYTTQGGHKLISWTDFMKVGEYGYGMPRLNMNAINPAAVLTDHENTIGELDWGNGSKARLLGMVGEIFLEVRTAEQLARKPIRILPLGDSITEGYNGGGNCANYRTQLAAKLSMAGYMVETLGYHYVRSRMPSGEWAPIEWQYHAGVSAQRVWTSKTLGGGFNNRAGDMEAIEATLNVCDGEPDVVLVKLGTNDIGNADPADHIFDGLKKTINTIHAKFPNAKVIVTTAVMYGSHNEIRTPYNTLIRNAFAADGEFADKSSWLHFVDQCKKVGDGSDYGSFNDAQGRVLFYSDATHPDWAGHDLMSDGWYEKIVEIVGKDAGKDKAPKPEYALGAKANVPAEYLNGFVRYRQLDIAEEAAYPQEAFDSYTWKSDKTVTGIEKVGYFMELVRKDNGAHTFVWVDMDNFGNDTVQSFGLPTTATTQKVVNKLHVYSNLGSVHNVAANDDTVKGYLEFSPFNSTSGALSGEGVPTKLWDAMDWNDTFASSGAGRGAMQVHRVKKEGDELWNGGEVVFAYNNWGSANTGRDGTKAGEIGIGNFCQHYMTDTSTNGNGHEINALYGGGSIGLNNNQISVDYTATRFSPVGDRVNAKAYEVMSLEIWVKPANVEITEEEVEATETEIAVVVPAGADSVVVTTAEGETVTGNKIPFTTGVYTISAKKNGNVVDTETLGVIAAKDAEDETAPAVTVAVAVPFKGATVANLLNTALLNAGDEIKALTSDQKYHSWKLVVDSETGAKSWSPMPTVRSGETETAPDPTTMTLKRGAAVWVTTAGQVVAFGAYDSTPVDPEVSTGYNLIGNPMMSAIEPEAKTVGDVLIPVGSSNRYKVIEKAGGTKVWQCTKSVQDGVIPGTTIPAFGDDISEENPTVEVGGSVWLIKE